MKLVTFRSASGDEATDRLGALLADGGVLDLTAAGDLARRPMASCRR
jgi:hypothetical protein